MPCIINSPTMLKLTAESKMFYRDPIFHLASMTRVRVMQGHEKHTAEQSMYSQDFENRVSVKPGLWTDGLDCWTGPMDWTNGLESYNNNSTMSLGRTRHTRHRARGACWLHSIAERPDSTHCGPRAPPAYGNTRMRIIIQTECANSKALYN